MKNYILTLFILSSSFTLYAKDRLAIINDLDGYTNIRSGPGKQHKVIDTLYTEDFFYFQVEDHADWVKIIALTDKRTTGFIHKSRIQDVEMLGNEKKKILISKILNKQSVLADEFRNGWKSKNAATLRRELELYSDTKYSPILNILAHYLCETIDTEVIQIFFTTMWADQGSANESPSFTLGECFRCNSDLIIEQLNTVKSIEQRRFILDMAGFGLSNIFEAKDNETFKALNTLIDKEKRKLNK